MHFPENQGHKAGNGSYGGGPAGDNRVHRRIGGAKAADDIRAYARRHPPQGAETTAHKQNGKVFKGNTVINLPGEQVLAQDADNHTQGGQQAGNAELADRLAVCFFHKKPPKY